MFVHSAFATKYRRSLYGANMQTKIVRLTVTMICKSVQKRFTPIESVAVKIIFVRHMLCFGFSRSHYEAATGEIREKVNTFTAAVICNGKTL